jgi:hypothetical protein
MTVPRLSPALLWIMLSMILSDFTMLMSGMDELVARIERIVHDKIKANRLEPNGEIVIRSIDVLRFGSNPIGREEAHGPDEKP